MSGRGAASFARRPPAAGAPALAVAAFVAALAGCATVDDPATERTAARLSARSCVRLPPPPRSGRQIVPPAAPEGVAREVPGFSAEAVETARAIGVEDVLRRYAQATRDVRDDAGRVVALHERQRLSDRVLHALLDVQGTVAELQCERERGDRLAFVLSERQAARDRRLTMTSILSGATTGILGGAIGLAGGAATVADSVGVVGGAAEGGFGLAGLFGESGATLRIERNILGEVWRGPEASELLPATIWRMLNAPARDERDADGGEGDDDADAERAERNGRGRRGEDGGEGGGGSDGGGRRAEAGAAGRGGLPDRDAAGRHDGRSIRERLVAQWRRDGALGTKGEDERRRREALLFGDGGRFTTEDLQWRAALLDSLQARVWLISIDLERLMREIIRPPDEPPR